MRVNPGVTAKDIWQTAVVTHRGKSVEFDLTLGGKLKDGVNVFRDLNSFWKWFGEMNPTGTQKIFDALVDVQKSAGILGVTSSTRATIHEAVRTISNIMTVEGIKIWAENEKDIIYPDIPVEKDPNFPWEQTYDRVEYFELVYLSIALKVMILIWGEFIVRDKSLPTGAVEEQAMTLLDNTTWALSDAFERHFVFISSLTTGRIGVSAILDGISTSSLPRKLFSMIVVNKLSSTVLTHKGDEKYSSGEIINIVAKIHRDANTAIDSINKGDILTVPKVFDSSRTRSEEDNTSVAENYAVKENISEISKVYFDYFGRQTQLIATRLKFDVFMDNCQALVQYNSRRINYIPTDAQYKLVSVITGRAVGVRSLPYTIRKSALIIISIAQVIAFELGFPNISALLSGTVVLDDKKEVIPVSGRLLKGQIKAVQVEKINQVYPYRRKLKGSKAPYKNPALTAVEDLANLFAGVIWDVSVPEFVNQKVTLQPSSQGGYVVREDFRSELADFIIAINPIIRGV